MNVKFVVIVTVRAKKPPSPQAHVQSELQLTAKNAAFV